ncbi:MAG: PadR family transcriptional regulator [Candidatus Heimdallarchaeota archaeon]
MRTENLKKIILQMFMDREFYGYDVHKTLMSEDIKIEISRLYRVLNEMLREGLLEGYWEKSQFGPRKRIYKLGGKGREKLDQILLDAIITVHSFYEKYLLSLPPEFNTFNIIINQFVDKLERECNIGYLTNKYSVMHERMINTLHNNILNGKLYFIKPDSVQADLNLNNLLSLDGVFDDIPIKNDYFDFLIVIGIPPKKSLAESIREWHRVLNKNGKLAILIPTVLIHSYKDPMTIGEFIEKYEHDKKGNLEQITQLSIQAMLKNFFNKVEAREIVHFTVFQVSEPCILRE